MGSCLSRLGDNEDERRPFSRRPPRLCDGRPTTGQSTLIPDRGRGRPISLDDHFERGLSPVGDQRDLDRGRRRYRNGSGPSRPVSPTHSWTQNRKRQGTKSREEQESLARQQVADSYSQQSREEIRSGPTSSELLQGVHDSPNRAAMYLGGRRIETTGPYKARPSRSVTPLDKRKSASYPAHYMKGKEGGRRKYS